MRRSFDEFSAEVYRRGEEIKEKRKKRRVFITYLAPIALCFILSFSVLTGVMPILLSGKNEAPGGDSYVDAEGEKNNVTQEEGSSNGGYTIAISYITVYTDEGRTVYNEPDDIWDVFLYVEDYPEEFKYSKNFSSGGEGAHYKVMVCMRDGATHYYTLSRLSDDEVINGFRDLMERLGK